MEYYEIPYSNPHKFDAINVFMLHKTLNNNAISKCDRKSNSLFSSAWTLFTERKFRLISCLHENFSHFKFIL